MKQMMVGRFITWMGAGAFATGLNYGADGVVVATWVQFLWAGILLSYGMHLIKKGGKEAC
ncbi:hypothetical protein LWL40_27705 (plasmid) [Bacillus thuringiensis]|uniref:hypothetical protein n=1 Tax=Bacillus thuringiensis TaxID=1428 RepID=UPI003D713118